MGQAQLARYPVHFHFDKDFDYRSKKYGQTEKQSVSHLSIHDANSRFVTIHATNDVIGELLSIACVIQYLYLLQHCTGVKP